MKYPNSTVIYPVRGSMQNGRLWVSLGVAETQTLTETQSLNEETNLNQWPSDVHIP